MVKTPVVATLAIPLPASVPINALAMIATLAGPPRTYPSKAWAIFINQSPAPVTKRNWAKSMNETTMVADMLRVLPYIPLTKRPI